MQELKIKIINASEIEEKLRNLGAQFVEEVNFTDTYFKQPPGEVFKISETSKGYFLIQLKKNPEGKFEVVKNSQIENSAAVIAEMTREYGIKSTLKGRRRNFTLNDLKLTVNFITDRGTFLIVTGENPTPDFVTKALQIQNPEYIQVPFDELPSLSATTSAALSPFQS